MRLRAGFMVLLALAAFGCASGPPLLLGQPIKKPIAVLLRVSDDAAKTDELGGIASIVEAVSDGLSERGVQNQVYAADDEHPHPPMIEIRVEQWDPGDRGDRAGAGFALGVVGELATAGGYRVLCRIYRDGDTEPAYVQRYSGMIIGTSEDSSASTGTSVGKAILAGAFGSGPVQKAGVRGPASPSPQK